MADSKPAAYTAPALVASTSDPVRANAKLISLLALGHFVVDLNQGSLPALLPFLKAAHQLSYAAVATIVLAANVASSLVQPVFGYFADQSARRWMLPMSVLLTGAGFALMGLAPGYGTLVASTSDPVRANAKLISLLALGHFVVDLNQGSRPARLPFLKAARQLSRAHDDQ